MVCKKLVNSRIQDYILTGERLCAISPWAVSATGARLVSMENLIADETSDPSGPPVTDSHLVA